MCSFVSVLRPSISMQSLLFSKVRSLFSFKKTNSKNSNYEEGTGTFPVKMLSNVSDCGKTTPEITRIFDGVKFIQYFFKKNLFILALVYFTLLYWLGLTVFLKVSVHVMSFFRKVRTNPSWTATTISLIWRKV